MSPLLFHEKTQRASAPGKSTGVGDFSGVPIVGWEARLVYVFHGPYPYTNVFPLLLSNKKTATWQSEIISLWAGGR